MGVAVEFQGLHNVRDLGGTPVEDGTVKAGLLFRGDQPFFATDVDKEKMFEMGIGTIVDFRSELERGEKPDPDISGVRNVHLPIVQDVLAGITHDSESDLRVIDMIANGADIDPAFIDAYMQQMYRGFVCDPAGTAQYARFVDEVIAAAERGRAVLWHCTAGKDRAGFATVILFEALGAPREAIFADYLETNERLSEVVEQILATIGRLLPNESSRSAVRQFFSADASHLAAAYECAEQRYGSFDAFLEQAIGLDGAKRARLRELFVS